MAAESPSWNGKHLAVYLIAFVLAIGPFFNGMFFEPIRLVGVALACVAYLLWYSGKRETSLAWNGVDWSVLAWFLSYLIASFTAILPRGHLSVVLDMVAFVGVYTVIRFGPRLERAVAGILLGSGAVMVAISVARFAGAAWLDRYVVDLIITGRLSGGFQYPNTFAVWLFCLVMLTLREARTPRVGSPLLALGGLFAGTFMLTGSRGALVAAPAAYIVVVLISSRQHKLFTCWAGLLTWGPAFVLGSAAFQAFQQQQKPVALLAIVACALPPLVTPHAAKFTEFLWSRKRTWGIATVGSLAIGALWAAPHLAGKALPVLRRFTDNRLTQGYELSDLNIFPRLVFDDYAWRIMSSNDFLGAGGRAWTKLFPQVRPFPYFSTEVHNNFLQTGVEAGLLGLLAFTAMLVLGLLIAWRCREQQQGDTTVAIWAGVVAFIGVHSAFDFDLSYISLQLMLAIALGVISSRGTARSSSGHRWVPLSHHALAGLTALAFITAGSLYISERAVLASDQAWARGDVSGTVSKLQLARQTDPLNSEPWQRMLALKRAIDPTDRSLPDTAVLLAKAHTLDAYEPSTILELARIALQEKRWVQGFDLAIKADSLVPLDQDLNATVASMMWSAVSGALADGDLPVARTLTSGLKAYQTELNRRFNQAERYRKYTRAPFGYTGTIYLRIGQGLILTRDYAAATEHLREAAKSESDKAEATQWLFVALELSGSTQEADNLLQSNPELFAQFLQSDLYRNVVVVAKGS